MLLGTEAKIEKVQERVNRKEQEIKQRHQEAMRRELVAVYEELDAEMTAEYLGREAYSSWGKVSREIQSSVGLLRVHVHRLKRRRGGGSVYPLLESGGVARVSGPAVDHCLRVAVNQPYETTRQTLHQLCGMQMSRMGIWKVIQEQGTQERQRQEVERKRLFEHGELPAATQARKPSAIVQLDGVLIGTRETAETESL